MYLLNNHQFMTAKTYFILAAFSLVSCSIEETYKTIDQPITKESVNTIRSYEEALDIAKKSISLLDDPNITRGISNKRKINLNEISIYKQDIKTRSNSQYSNDTLIYVFNFENEEGFALVSASKNTEELLAVTEKGHCDVDKSSGIEGFDMFIEAAKTYVANAAITSINEPIDIPINIRIETIYDIHQYVSPKVNVKWGQNYTLGDFCNNHNAGCVNVALAQIMSYYQHPQSIIINYNGSNNTQQLNWNYIKNHQDHYSNTPCNYPEAHTAIANLARQLGELNNSNYNYNNYTYTIINPFKGSPVDSTIVSLGYTNKFYDSYSDNIIRKELDSNHLIMVNGWTTSNDGHTWIIDGYKYDSVLEYCYKQIGNGPEFLYETIDYTRHVNHINWGWNGYNNGYFSGGVFDTMNGTSYDQGTHSGLNNNYTTINLVSIYH